MLATDATDVDQACYRLSRASYAGGGRNSRKVLYTLLKDANEGKITVEKKNGKPVKIEQTKFLAVVSANRNCCFTALTYHARRTKLNGKATMNALYAITAVHYWTIIRNFGELSRFPLRKSSRN